MREIREDMSVVFNGCRGSAQQQMAILSALAPKFPALYARMSALCGWVPLPTSPRLHHWYPNPASKQRTLSNFLHPLRNSGFSLLAVWVALYLYVSRNT